MRRRALSGTRNGVEGERSFLSYGCVGEANVVVNRGHKLHGAVGVGAEGIGHSRGREVRMRPNDLEE
jgi:hypothetical protein